MVGPTPVDGYAGYKMHFCLELKYSISNKQWLLHYVFINFVVNYVRFHLKGLYGYHV